jgi:hypothetical protein
MMMGVAVNVPDSYRFTVEGKPASVNDCGRG